MLGAGAESSADQTRSGEGRFLGSAHRSRFSLGRVHACRCAQAAPRCDAFQRFAPTFSERSLICAPSQRVVRARRLRAPKRLTSSRQGDSHARQLPEGVARQASPESA
jgi:hypothetical protein